MDKKCQQCRWEIQVLDSSKAYFQEVIALVNQGKKLHAIQKIHQNTDIGLANAKGVLLHWHQHYGHCVRCDYTELREAYTECPNCCAFNYNIKVPGAGNDD